MKHLSRRTFLQAAGLALGAQSLAPLLAGESFRAQAQEGITHWDGSPQGRILLNVMTAYDQPDWRANATGTYRYNEIVTVLGVVVGYGLYPSNSTWLQTEKGYIYSSWVQPVNTINTNSTAPIGDGGAWGQLTVPIAYSKNEPNDDANDRERLYYSQVMRLTGVENDYYQVSEIYGNQFWIKANQIRIIPPEEVAPISPDVDPAAKRIEVSVRDQMFYAYEGEQIVYQNSISTGMPSTPTPFGDFFVRDKRHGQRMTGGLTGGGYNLAGIPYISYITKKWVAMHGTYWHNNYGRRMSNGCINMRPADAMWIFRWTTPLANYYAFNARFDDPGALPATPVKVRW